MSLYSIAAVFVLAGAATAKVSTNITVPVSVSAAVDIFDIAPIISNADATAFIQNLTRQGNNLTTAAFVEAENISGMYNISTQFCMPSSDPPEHPTLQILTHEVGFDRTYWDLAYDGFNYSYIDVATDEQKYLTLSYDSLGIGNSTHGDPVNEIQAELEIAALAQLTLMLRTSPAKVIHVGHSFGSVQTYGLPDAFHTLSDGIVLTGFSLNSSFMPLFLIGGNFVQANLNQPFRFGSILPSSGSTTEEVAAAFRKPLDHAKVEDILAEYDLIDYVAGLEDPEERVAYADGYITNSNTGANQFLFFGPSGRYDPGIVIYAEETKQAIAPGEFLTLGGSSSASAFAGPVLVLTGSNDLPFCGGDCYATGNPKLPSIPAAVVEAFPKVPTGDFAAIIQPETGHGINLHYNATGAYNVIGDFLAAKGLASTYAKVPRWSCTECKISQESV